jgi:hypothetical protein
MEKWKTIKPDVWKPEQKGDNIIGVVVNKEPKDEQANISARYYLENENGMFFVWGCAVLDDRMQYVKVGDKIRISYEGETTNKRNQKVNLYKVEVAEQAEKAAGEGNEDAPIDLEQIDSVK